MLKLNARPSQSGKCRKARREKREKEVYSESKKLLGNFEDNCFDFRERSDNKNEKVKSLKQQTTTKTRSLKQQTTNTEQSKEMDRMKEETKFVVLEYLSSLPPEKSRARNRHCSMPVNAKLSRSWPNAGRVVRRGSDLHDKKVRERLTNMLGPLRIKLSQDLLADITKFDKKRLKSASDDDGCQLPCLRFGTIENELTIPETPVTCVTLRLEQLSQSIMEDFPGILDKQFCELMTPLESTKKQISYEQFSAVATSVFENNWAKITKSIWAKVALVFYLVKEMAFSGVLSEIQIDLLVDYASRYVAENSFDCINKAGGWTALECHSDPLIGPDEFTGELYDPLGGTALTDSERTQVRSTHGHAEAVNNTSKTIFMKLTSYSCTAAVLAVGIGFAYIYLKCQ